MSVKEIKILDTKWCETTEVGNAFFYQKNNSRAMSFYKDALFYCEIILKNIADTSKMETNFPRQFFISCQNLANNYLEIPDVEKANDYFFYAVWHLKLLSEREHLPNLTKLEVLKHWQMAVLAMYDFFEKTGIKNKTDFWCEETYENIKKAHKELIGRKVLLN